MVGRDLVQRSGVRLLTATLQTVRESAGYRVWSVYPK